ADRVARDEDATEHRFFGVGIVGRKGLAALLGAEVLDRHYALAISVHGTHRIFGCPSRMQSASTPLPGRPPAWWRASKRSGRCRAPLPRHVSTLRLRREP